MKIEQLTEDDMRAMIDDELVRAHRMRRMSPDKPVLRGIGAEPGRFLPGAGNLSTRTTSRRPPSCRRPWTSSPPSSAGNITSFDYVGAPDAERVIVMMGSGAEAAQEAVEYLTARGEKVGLLKVRLYRPFSVEALRAGASASVNAHHRGAGSHQGTGRRGRAALPGCRHRGCRNLLLGQRLALQSFPEDHRWTLRPVLEGIHARHGQAAFSTS